jgi:hypothetical protein
MLTTAATVVVPCVFKNYITTTTKELRAAIIALMAAFLKAVSEGKSPMVLPSDATSAARTALRLNSKKPMVMLANPSSAISTFNTTFIRWYVYF